MVVPLFGAMAGIRATQLVQQKGWAPSTLFLIFVVSVLFIVLLAVIRVSIHGFNGFHIQPNTGMVTVKPFLGRSVGFNLSDVAGYSASRVGWGNAAHDGIILYVPSWGHFEMSDYTHPDLASFVQLIKERNIPYFGQERSWWLFLKYRFDPK